MTVCASIGDSFGRHLSIKFSTPDEDNDNWIHNCAQVYTSGWWFDVCSRCNLNGPYHQRANRKSKGKKGVEWKTWLDFDYSLKSTEMKVRPFYVHEHVNQATSLRPNMT